MFASVVSVHQKMQVRLVRNWNDVAIKFFVLSNEICIGAILQKKNIPYKFTGFQKNP